MRRIDARGCGSLLDQRLRGAHQTMSCHYDSVVGRDQILLGSIADRSHALLQGSVLDREAGYSAKRFAGLLRGAIDEIVVVLVGQRPIGARNVFAMHAGTVAHGVNLATGERTNGM